ncbi:MAG: radical SAM protein [Smithellaceae bacterium]|nr:radical SAM protein [Smithellaceae bacterium]
MKRKIVAGRATRTFDFFIQWHLTERCNLRCRHCYQQRRRPREMSVGDVKRAIDGATEMFRAWEEEYDIALSPSIHFTGGEPFLYRGMWDAVSYARAQGIGVAILTNGTLITAEDAARAAELRIMDIQVSLEGPPAVHDGIRGEGSFAAAVLGARLLARAGNTVSANMTLSRLNIGVIKETAAVARESGFSAMGLSRLVPCGTGEGLKNDMLAPEEIRSAFAMIPELSDASFEIASGDPLLRVLTGPPPKPDCRLALSGCSAGFSGITIISDGSVMPCRRMGIKIGNVLETPLREIWSTSDLLWQLRHRSSYQGKCGKCLYWPSCRGCRAVAYACSQAAGKPDIFADDPQCWLPQT